MASVARPSVLQMQGMSKTFPGVQALQDVDFEVYEGEIHGLVGKNGAGKSTLVRSVLGILPYEGEIRVNGLDPLRDGKGTTYEGGMREPTVVRWPGKIPAGEPNDKLMTTMDLLPTFAKLAGAEIPTARIIDGKDIWPTLAGEAGTPFVSC